MDLTQIHYFLALARTLNFTRAAEACNVSQPALTKSIQRLEEELGGKLLLRERALTQLTPLGREMRPLLQQIQDTAQLAKTHAKAMRSRRAAPLRLGFSPDAPVLPFAPLFAELARALPGFELRLVEMSRTGLVDTLLAGALDVAVVTDSASLPERMNRWAMFEDAVVLLLPPCHEAADGLPIGRDALSGDLAPCALAYAGGTVFEAAGADLPAARHQAANAAQAAALLRAGLGSVFSTARAERPATVAQAGLAWCPPHAVLLAAVAGRPVTAAADAFLKLARARAWPGA